MDQLAPGGLAGWLRFHSARCAAYSASSRCFGSRSDRQITPARIHGAAKVRVADRLIRQQVDAPPEHRFEDLRQFDEARANGRLRLGRKGGDEIEVAALRIEG